MVYQVAPRVLKEQGKARIPGRIRRNFSTLQYHCGHKEYDFYTVLFGVGRVLGLTANLVWRARFIHRWKRPQSITMDMLEKALSRPPENWNIEIDPPLRGIFIRIWQSRY